MLDEHLALLEDLGRCPADLDRDGAMLLSVQHERRLALEVGCLHMGEVEDGAAQVVLGGGRRGMPDVLDDRVVVVHLDLELVGEQVLERAVELEVLVPHRVERLVDVRSLVEHVVAQEELGVPTG